MQWTSIIRSSQNDKISSVRVAFLLWMVTLCLVWGILSFKDSKMYDLPSTVVHITLALGATKVTHRLAEGNTDKIISAITDIIKSRLIRKSVKKSKK